MPQINPPIVTQTSLVTFNILDATDYPIDRRVFARVQVITDANQANVVDLTLWDGDAYDAIGDWTQADAETRVLELLKS